MKKRVIWPVVIVFLVFILVWAIQRYFHEEPSFTLPRKIRYSFTLKNTTNRFVKNVGLRVYAPVKQTSSQICRSVNASHPYELSTDSLGNQILYFSFDSISPYASKIIDLEAELLLSASPCKISQTTKVSPFLKPEPKVESGRSEIRTRARKLAKSDRLATAKAIHQWVAGYIKYSGYWSDERGAYYALSRKKGDCTEYMDLFAALCRAADIPCRRVGGYICDKNKVVNSSGYHNWAEFHLDGKWLVADPQNRVFMENSVDYITMHIISNHCLNEMGDSARYRLEGEGMTVRMDS